MTILRMQRDEKPIPFWILIEKGSDYSLWRSMTDEEKEEYINSSHAQMEKNKQESGEPQAQIAELIKKCNWLEKKYAELYEYAVDGEELTNRLFKMILNLKDEVRKCKQT